MRQIILALGVCCLVGGVASTRIGRKPAAPVETAAVAAPGGAVTPVVTTAPNAITLNADERGHFLTDAVVDGRSLRMVVDTGASACVIMEEDAERLGLRPSPSEFRQEVATANGVIRVAPVRLNQVRIGAVSVRDVEAVVVPRGRLHVNLLGMSFLRRLHDFNIAGGRLTLRS